MGKNKKKSISKVVITHSISNGSDNDEPVKSTEVNSFPIKIDDTHQKIEEDDTLKTIEQAPLEQIKTAVIVEVNDTSKSLVELEKVPNSDSVYIEENNNSLEVAETNIEVKSVSQDVFNINGNNGNTDIGPNDENEKGIELTEIQIKNEENSSPKKPTRCSRGWCSIL
jgi:hypothetical protein